MTATASTNLSTIELVPIVANLTTATSPVDEPQAMAPGVSHGTCPFRRCLNNSRYGVNLLVPG
ncbi:hypothetical protein GCM10009599_12210 [Luteococcus peritonei]